MKKAGEKITVLTAYDASIARLLHACDVDILLVGDSLGMVVLGYDSTVPVTMDQMIHHSSAVRRGAPEAFVVGDMPFGSYQSGPRDAILNAGRFLKEAGCDAVKLETAEPRVLEITKSIIEAGIPVLGHLGLTPQSVSALGGFRLQGKGAAQAKKIVDDAAALEDAGAFCILLELVPDRVCRLITERAKHCIIMSLGSGPDAHGQLLIYHDAFALYPKFTPRMAKVFADAGAVIRSGLAAYVDEVTGRTFPQPENWFGMKDEEFDELVRLLG